MGALLHLRNHKLSAYEPDHTMNRTSLTGPDNVGINSLSYSAVYVGLKCSGVLSVSSSVSNLYGVVLTFSFSPRVEPLYLGSDAMVLSINMYFTCEPPWGSTTGELSR